jgi:hypothetical protein
MQDETSLGYGYDDVVGDIPDPDEIMLTNEQMTDLYFKSQQSIRSFLAQANKQGIDIVNPNPDDPESMRRHRLLQDAIAKHKEATQKMARTKENQDFMLEAMRDKGTLFGKDVGQGEFITEEDVMRSMTPRDLKLVDNVNNVLRTFTVSTPSDQQAVQEYRDAAISEIDQMMAQSAISPDAAAYYKSQIMPAPTLDTQMRDAKLASEDALRRQRNASAAASYRSSKGNSNDQVSQPFLFKSLVTKARSFMDLSKQGIAGPNDISLTEYSGLYLNGDRSAGFRPQSMRIRDGNIEIVFKSTSEIDPVTGREIMPSQTRVATFPNMDIVSAYMSMFPPQQARQERKMLEDAGIEVEAQYDLDKLDRVLSGMQTDVGQSGETYQPGSPAAIAQPAVDQPESPAALAPVESFTGQIGLWPESPRAAFKMIDPSNVDITAQAITEAISARLSPQEMVNLRMYVEDYMRKLNSYAKTYQENQR